MALKVRSADKDDPIYSGGWGAFSTLIAPASVGAFFGLALGMILDRAGGVSALRSRPRKPLPYS